MKKPDFTQLANTLANIGVIAGILFLAYELRQNTHAIRGTTVQAIADQSLNTVLAGVENPELRESYLRVGQGLENMTLEDWNILVWYYSAIMRISENRFRQAEIGTVGVDFMGQVGGTSIAYRHPFFGHFWELRRDEYPEDFALWVDENLIPYVQDSVEVAPDDLLSPPEEQTARTQP